MKNFFSLAIIILSCIYLYPQSFDNGVPFVKNYLPVDYDGESQNWAIVQDNRGVMYFGNTKGLLEFDGTHWRLIDPVNAYVAKKDSNGTIFLAGKHDYGYLCTNPLGQVKFNSLKPLITDTIDQLGNFYSIEFYKGKVYFGEYSGRIHVYDYNSIEIIQTEFISMNMCKVNDKLFVGSQTGLFVLNNNTLTEASGAEWFVGYNPVGMLILNSKLLLITRLNGLFTYDNVKLLEWDVPAGQFIKKYQVYRAAQVDENHIALGSVENGMLLMNEKGEPKQHVNTKGGMVNHDHCSIYGDSWGNIWSGLENGISYIQVNSPFTFFNEQVGLNNSAIFSIRIFDSTLYVGTAQGVMYQDLSLENASLSEEWNFNYVQNNVGRKAWDLLVNKGKLITGYSNIGTFKIEKKVAQPMVQNNIPQQFLADSTRNYLVCVRQHGGLVVLKDLGARLELQNVIEGNYQVKYLAKDYRENYWIYLSNGELECLTFSADYNKITHRKTFNKESGLPNVLNFAPFSFNDTVFFGTELGTYAYSYSTDSFNLYEPINKRCVNAFIYKTIKASATSTCFLGKKQGENLLGIMNSRNNNHSIEIIEKPLTKLSPFEIKTVYPLDSNTFLFGCIDRLVQFKKSYKSFNVKDFNVLLRSVEITKPQDSLVFGGFLDSVNFQLNPVEFQFENNALRFAYAAVFFDEANETEYSYKLKGYDNSWSEWTSKTEKEYSYLKPGEYMFEVKAKNIYGEISFMQPFLFKICPPWYQTVFAYSIYVIFFILLSRLVILFSIRKIKNEKENLERIVAERTRKIVKQRDEIVTKNIVLNEQKAELSQQHEELIAHREKTLDSLTYAEQIQKALLTKTEYFKQLFCDSFILYKPKDIVSGDFYWLRDIDDSIFIAVADSTGHGVPGAFMSVIGITYLNEIVQQNGITQPSLVLEELRKKVKTALNQDLEDSLSENNFENYFSSIVKDGIDMAFCRIDKKSKKLTYSGANLPLLLISEGKLLELSPIDNPIGIYLKEEAFVDTNIELKAEDCIYMYSDGYYDQFGGPDNKKFYLDNFKKLLIKNHKMPLAKQKEQLLEILENWQGDTEQIDDVMVIGLKV